MPNHVVVDRLDTPTQANVVSSNPSFLNTNRIQNIDHIFECRPLPVHVEAVDYLIVFLNPCVDGICFTYLPRKLQYQMPHHESQVSDVASSIPPSVISDNIHCFSGGNDVAI